MSALREVVGAVIVRDGRVLLTQRRPGKSFPFCHESPGGKVDPGEYHHDALRRECGEELGIDVCEIPQRPLWCGEVDSPNGGARVSLYLVTEWIGEPSACEGQGLGWYEPCEIPGLVMTPANALAVREIVRAVEASAAAPESWFDAKMRDPEFRRAFEAETILEQEARHREELARIREERAEDSAYAGDGPHPSHVTWEGGESDHDGGKACVACGAFVHGFRADEPCSGKRRPPPTVEEARATFERAMADERRRLPVPSASDGVRTPEDAIAWLAADPARREAFNALRPAPEAVDKKALRQMVRDLRWQEASDDDIHAALYAAGRASRGEEVKRLTRARDVLLAALTDHALGVEYPQCLAAGPGEGTLECRISVPCDSCRLSAERAKERANAERLTQERDTALARPCSVCSIRAALANPDEPAAATLGDVSLVAHLEAVGERIDERVRKDREARQRGHCLPHIQPTNVFYTVDGKPPAGWPEAEPTEWR